MFTTEQINAIAQAVVTAVAQVSKGDTYVLGRQRI